MTYRQDTDTRAPAAGTKPSVDALLASWPMRLSFRPMRGLSDCVLLLLVFTLIAAILCPAVLLVGRDSFFDPRPKLEAPAEEDPSGGVSIEEGDYPFADGAAGSVLLPWAENSKVIPESTINSAYAVLADAATGEIVASRKADESIYPASMTKVMTLIVVVENLPRESCLKDTITISQDVYDRMKQAESSGVGLEPGEKLTVEALIYALVLKSDGIAACELARYVAGSEEDFVELMNQKAEKMGLTKTHFMNPTGLYHKDHTSSARDIATIMSYAMNMQLCRRVLKTQSYTAPCTDANGATFNYNLYHGLTVTWFDKIQPNQPSNVTVVAGKTGFTDESRYCLVSYAESADGHGYICVTAKGDSYQACISDYITIYDSFAKP